MTQKQNHDTDADTQAMAASPEDGAMRQPAESSANGNHGSGASQLNATMIPTVTPAVDATNNAGNPSANPNGQAAPYPTTPLVAPAPTPAPTMMSKPGTMEGVERGTKHLTSALLPETITPKVTGPLDRRVPWVIEFRVVGTPTTMQVQVRDEMLMGRADAEQGYFPEVDLAAFKGYAYGVSRKHGRIFIKDERMHYEDLASTNGSAINGQVCAKAEHYRLRHGDELTLGRLRMQVRFAVVPSNDETGNWKKREAQAVQIPQVGKGQFILILEDDKEVGQVFRDGLEQGGFKAGVVSKVSDALTLLTAQMPDAIILNLMMPDMSGIDFMRYVRKAYPQQKMPLIVVSNTMGTYQMQQALDAGADAFMGKPVAVAELVHLVADAVKQPQKQQAK